MDGVTHSKTTAMKAAIDADGRLRRSFRMNKSSSIYEGCHMLNFELCQERSIGSSRAIAHCATSMATVFGDRTGGKNWHFELTSVDVPGKVIAHLVLNIQLWRTALREAGGFQMLKSKTVPIRPLRLQPGPQKLLPIELEDANAFLHCADRTRERLRQIDHEVETAWQTQHEKVGLRCTYIPSIPEADESIELPVSRVSVSSSGGSMSSIGDLSNELSLKTPA